MTIQTNGIHAEEAQPGRLPRNSSTPEGAPAQRITITLSAEDLALLDEVSKGNHSEGVRLALRALRTQQAELKRIIAGMAADPAGVVAHDELQRRLAQKKAGQHAVAP